MAKHDRYAPHGHCPVFNCGTPLPNAHAVVCAQHYFELPQAQVRAAVRMKIKAATEVDPKRKAKFADQAEKHTKHLVKQIAGSRA
ncbi:MAG: hypothetical protein AAGG72_00095 [Pseudomonadota bacterium]